MFLMKIFTMETTAALIVVLVLSSFLAVGKIYPNKGVH